MVIAAQDSAADGFLYVKLITVQRLAQMAYSAYLDYALLVNVLMQKVKLISIIAGKLVPRSSEVALSK